MYENLKGTSLLFYFQASVAAAMLAGALKEIERQALVQEVIAEIRPIINQAVQEALRTTSTSQPQNTRHPNTQSSNTQNSNTRLPNTWSPNTRPPNTQYSTIESQRVSHDAQLPSVTTPITNGLYWGRFSCVIIRFHIIIE